MTLPPLILGSASPRRQELLKSFGLSFDICPADIDETSLKAEHPRVYVQRLAREKAAKVAQAHPKAAILAGDSTVALGRRIFGKPENEKDAARILNILQGRRHRVFTGLCLRLPCGKNIEIRTNTVVKFVPLREKDIQAYVAKEENWQGVAGGYAMQKPGGSQIVQWINGSPGGVIGMPLHETGNILKQAGYLS